jgi:hypothetical protein
MTLRCPTCRTEIQGKVADGEQVSCTACHRRYRIAHSSFSGKTSLIPMDMAAVAQPLGLPRGSIRALITLMVAGACWALMIGGQRVPHYLLNLLLAIIAYYFGFRQRSGPVPGPGGDAYAKSPEPLHLPGGSIRMILILGFAVSGFLMLIRGGMADLAHAEFFLLLAGLVAGYFFARLFRTTDAATYSRFNHLRGIAALVAAGWLAVSLLSGTYVAQPHTGLIPACIITFYFGSRSGEAQVMMGRVDRDIDRLRSLRQERLPSRIP